MLGSRFQADLKYDDASIEKTDRDWEKEKAKWKSLSLEDKRRKHYVPQELVETHDEKIEEKKKFIAQMQKQLNSTKVRLLSYILSKQSCNSLSRLQAQKLKEERESQKLSKEESGINTHTRVMCGPVNVRNCELNFQAFQELQFACAYLSLRHVTAKAVHDAASATATLPNKCTAN